MGAEDKIDRAKECDDILDELVLDEFHKKVVNSYLLAGLMI